MAKIKILVYGDGQDLNGEDAMVGIISGQEENKNGFFFARMVETEGRQRWQGQKFFGEEAEALRYWRRQCQPKITKISA